MERPQIGQVEEIVFRQEYGSYIRIQYIVEDISLSSKWGTRVSFDETCRYERPAAQWMLGVYD
jgi:hypothetical protein